MSRVDDEQRAAAVPIEPALFHILLCRWLTGVNLPPILACWKEGIRQRKVKFLNIWKLHGRSAFCFARIPRA